MKLKTSLLTVAGMLAFAPGAYAQTTTQSAPPAAPAGAAPSAAAPAATQAAKPTPDEVQKFAKAAVEVNKIQEDATVPAAGKQEKMVAALQTNGLTPQRFNEIAQAAQADPALLKEIQAAAPPPPAATSGNASAPTGAAPAGSAPATPPAN